MLGLIRLNTYCLKTIALSLINNMAADADITSNVLVICYYPTHTCPGKIKNYLYTFFHKERLWVPGAQREHYRAKENEPRHNKSTHTIRLHDHSFNSPHVLHILFS